MFVTADQLFCHAIGDYVLQSHWMATEKTRQSWAALCHAVTYTAPFVCLSQSLALVVICLTHFVIDRWRLARFVVWWKNLAFAPRHVANEIMDDTLTNGVSPTGFPTDTPAWLSVWLLIIVDNLLHVAINALALKYL